MKKCLSLVLVLVVFVLFGVSCSKVPAGTVGIKVYLLGGSKGVDSEELSPGRYWIGWNEDLFIFPMFTQNYVWTAGKDEGSQNNESIDFQSREGLSFNGDFGISYAVKPGSAAVVFQKYRKGLEEVTDIYLRNMVRDGLNTIASTMTAEEIYGEKKGELIKSVEKFVREQVNDMFVIENIYLIGNLRLPDKVLAAMNEKMAANQAAQQKENEVRGARADAEKAVAKARGEADSTLLKAKAEAEANLLVAKSLTKELVEWKALQTWDGKLPQVSGGAVPFINLSPNK